MLKKLRWYDIAIRLRDFIKNYHTKYGERPFNYLVDRDDLKIKVGSGNVGEFPAIWILFGSEEDTNHQSQRIGAMVQFWIDLYVKGGQTDEVDFDDICYRQMYQLTQDVMNMLYEFQKVLQKDYGLGVHITTPAVFSDGDENAPVNTMNRIICNIEWYENR